MWLLYCYDICSLFAANRWCFVFSVCAPHVIREVRHCASWIDRVFLLVPALLSPRPNAGVLTTVEAGINPLKRALDW